MPRDPLIRLTTGVPGLDEVLKGGLIAHRAYMVRGGPGTGKTILGLHFLTAAAPGERALLITLGEAEPEIRKNAGILGFDLDKVDILDLSPTSAFYTEMHTYDIFSPAEVERDPTTQRINEVVNAVQPVRVLVDGMTQFRYLAPNAFQFRKQVLSFLRYLSERGATVVFTSESTEGPDEDLQFLADGVLELSSSVEGRSVMAIKFRGSDFRSGRHSLHITGRGMEVFPRLIPGEYQRPFEFQALPSGIPELDCMLNGGIERGTISLITGPSGVGKTTVGLQFMKQAAAQGERSVVYIFEESRETLLRRCEAVKIPVREMLAKGTLAIVQVEPLRYTADQFARMVRQEVEQDGARLVMIDSIAGYRLSVQGGDLVSHLHALSKYLQNMGIAVLLINEVEYLTGDFRITDVGVSYVSDNIIFLRYLEMNGEMCKALGVLKKRLSDFEKSLRELRITPAGVIVGDRLTNLRGILSGTPDWAAPDVG